MSKGTSLKEFIAGKTYEQIAQELSADPYNVKVKEDGEYYILVYDQIRSNFEYLFVRECRGIILRKDTNEIVCWPFTKFFNFGEANAAKIDWNSARVQEKVDGSIIKMWFDGDWHVSTNGTIDANKAELQSDLPSAPKSFGNLFMDAMFDFMKKNGETVRHSLDTDYTYMFELTSPFNRVVVPHKEVKVYHIGTRHNKTGQEVNIDIGFPKPREFKLNSYAETVAAAQELPFSEEGYVVVDGNWNRVKIKSPAYVAAHHLKNNGVITVSRILDMVRINESAEFLSYYPEYEKDFKSVEKAYREFREVLDRDVAECLDRIKNWPLSQPESKTRKEFAAWATKTAFPGLMFSVLDGKVKSAQEYMDKMDSDKLAKLIEGGIQ